MSNQNRIGLNHFNYRSFDTGSNKIHSTVSETKKLLKIVARNN